MPADVVEAKARDDAAAPAATPVAAARPTDALFDADLDDDAKPVALYFPDKSTLAWAESWSEEGTGEGLAVVVRGADGAEERLEVYAPGTGEDEQPKRIEVAKATLATRFAGDRLVRLEASAWPPTNSETDAKPKDTMALDAVHLRVTYKRRQLTATDAAGKVVGRLDLGKEAIKPHVPHPAVLFAAAGAKPVLVDVAFDPGDGYTEGFIYYTKTYVLVVP